MRKRVLALRLSKSNKSCMTKRKESRTFTTLTRTNMSSSKSKAVESTTNLRISWGKRNFVQKLKTVVFYARPIVVLGGLPAVYISGSTTHPEEFTIPTSLRSSYESISDSKPVLVAQPSFWTLFQFCIAKFFTLFTFCTSISITSYILGCQYSIPSLRLHLDTNLYDEFSTYLYTLAPTTFILSVLMFLFRVGSYKTIKDYKALRNKALKPTLYRNSRSRQRRTPMDRRR